MSGKVALEGLSQRRLGECCLSLFDRDFAPVWGSKRGLWASDENDDDGRPVRWVFRLGRESQGVHTGEPRHLCVVVRHFFYRT